MNSQKINFVDYLLCKDGSRKCYYASIRVAKLELKHKVGIHMQTHTICEYKNSKFM